MLGTDGSKAGGRSSLSQCGRAPQRAARASSTYAELPGTRLQRASVCLAQCLSVAAAVESMLKKSIQRYSYEVSGLLTYLKH